LAQQSGGQVAITLRELPAGGQSWSYQGDAQFTAASTYKLPVLVAEAQGISNGTLSPNDSVCYQASEWEDGWYQDYTDGACFARQDLAGRVGTYSDNTAAHMLVDNLGGSLNPTAAKYGATNSDFDTSNVTTSNDLAAIWSTEYSGNAGGAAAQAWLYPLLTHTVYEDGIPAGVPGTIQVVHKIGEYGTSCNDAALVLNGNHPYVLVVMTDSTGQNFAPLAAISARVWQYEQQLS
jgi:beta-lactamase class A